MPGALGTGRKGTERFLVVRLAGREHGIRAERICGMLQMRGLAFEPIEGRGPLRYLVQVQGRTLPVYVPNRALGLKELPISARTSILLVKDGGESDAARYALLVDSISRVEDVPASDARPESSHPTQIRLGGKWRNVLEIDIAFGAGKHRNSDRPQGDDETIDARPFLNIAPL